MEMFGHNADENDEMTKTGSSKRTMIQNMSRFPIEWLNKK